MTKLMNALRGFFGKKINNCVRQPEGLSPFEQQVFENLNKLTRSKEFHEIVNRRYSPEGEGEYFLIGERK